MQRLPRGLSICHEGRLGHLGRHGENGLAVAGANKAALESVLTGAKAILVAGVDYNAYSQIKKGEPIGIYYPASGTVVNPRPAMILKTTKNEAAARAFIDYLLSDDAQNWWLRPSFCRAVRTSKPAAVWGSMTSVLSAISTGTR